MLDRANHTGTQSADTITDGVNNKAYTTVEKSKVANVPADTVEELANKANKIQEDWIIPTLLDGATGTAYYRKNQFGELEIHGDIIIETGTVPTPLFATIDNYKPLSVSVFRAYNNTSGGMVDLVISSTGRVSLRTTANTGDKISFSVVLPSS